MKKRITIDLNPPARLDLGAEMESTSKSKKEKTPRQEFLSAFMTLIGGRAAELADLYVSGEEADKDKLIAELNAVAQELVGRSE